MTDTSWPGRFALPFARRAATPWRSLRGGEALLEAAGIGAWVFDSATGKLWWSRQTCRIHRVPDDFVPDIETALDFYAPEARETVAKSVADLAEHQREWDLELPLICADGTRIQVRARGRNGASEGEPGIIMGTFEDITERHRANIENQHQALIVRQMTNAAIISDARGRTIWVNNAFSQLTGYDLAALEGKTPGSLLQGPDTDPADVAAIGAALANGTPITREILNYNRAGTPYWVEVKIDPIIDAAGTVTGYVGINSDVTARREAADLARLELARRTATETLLRDVIDGIPAGLTVYDRNEKLVLFNHSYGHMLPYMDSFMAVGEPMAEIIARKVAADHYVPEISGDSPPQIREAWIADYLLRHRTPGYNRVFLLSNDRWVQASNAISTSGNIVSIRTDITALKQAEAELRYTAENDALTGLANRAVLMARLNAVAAAPVQAGDPGTAIILFDIDFFKAVNDGLGHAAGDQLLRIMARRLQRLTRCGDTAARLGGDEFALLAEGLADDTALTAFLQRLLAALRRPMRLGRTRYSPSVSIGVTRFPADGRTAETLLGNADAALYEAKRQGRGRFALFDQALAGQVDRRLRLADKLRVAVAERRIDVALQPQASLADGSIIGFEALARWHDGDEWVPPHEFVGIAEDVGLAQGLGALVMDRSLEVMAMMLAQGLQPGRLAVNVSTAQLLADDFVGTVTGLLDRHGIAPQQFEIEVTETVLLDRSIAHIEQTLARLRQLGIALAMDDFGTGYASMSHLTAFPVDRIKVDTRFTAAIDGGVDGGGSSGLIARTLIALGQGLGLEVVAEGVETRAQLDFLKAHGCTAVQGYLIGRPMFAPEAMAWLRKRSTGRVCRSEAALSAIA